MFGRRKVDAPARVRKAEESPWSRSGGGGSSERSRFPELSRFLGWIRRLSCGAIALALEDLAAVSTEPGYVFFFDRGLIGAAVGLEHLVGEPAAAKFASAPVFPKLFLAPPWPEILVTDAERRHGFDAALAE